MSTLIHPSLPRFREGEDRISSSVFLGAESKGQTSVQSIDPTGSLSLFLPAYFSYPACALRVRRRAGSGAPDVQPGSSLRSLSGDDTGAQRVLLLVIYLLPAPALRGRRLLYPHWVECLAGQSQDRLVPGSWPGVMPTTP